jgi:uncharacterized protein YkwD
MSPAMIASPRRLCACLCAALMAVALAAAGPAQATSKPSTSTVEKSLASAMLTLFNSERKQHHLAPLSVNAKLITSAHGHNLMMAKDNEMSHQLPGEAVFSTRITRAGYKWSHSGENIGWDSVETKAAILSLEKMMYDEKPPDDGHRLNILGKFKNIGIDVYFDTKHHKMWFTQDLGYPA